MNKQAINHKLIAMQIRVALRVQSYRMWHLIGLNCTEVVNLYAASHEASGGGIARFFLPPVYALAWTYHQLKLMLTSLMLIIESLLMFFATPDVFRENDDQIGFVYGIVPVFILVTNNATMYHAAIDIDHFEDLWSGHYD